MVGIKEVIQPLSSHSVLDRVSTILVFLYQVIGLVTFAIVPVLAVGWLSTPFLGAFFEHTMVSNAVGPTRAGSWQAYDAGIDVFGIQLKSVNGVSVRSASELQGELKRYEVGEQVAVSFQQDEQFFNLDITLQSFPMADRLAFFFFPYSIGVIYLLCSLWVYSLRRNDAAGRAFALFSTSAAIVLATFFDLYTSHRLTALWSVSLALAGGGVFIMALLFPEEVGLVRKRPFVRWLALVPAGLLIANTLPRLFDLSHPFAYVQAWRWEFIYAGLGLFTLIGLTLYRRIASKSPISREQAQITLWGSAIAFFPIASWLILTVFFPRFTFQPLLLFSLVLFPVAITYAILRYRLLNTDFLVSRGLLYAALALISASVFFLLVWGSNIILRRSIPAKDPLLIGLMSFLLAAIFDPLRRRLQSSIDALFFRGQTIYRERLQDFSHQLTQTINLDKIIQVLREYVTDSLKPAQLHIFLHDPLSDQYFATLDGSQQTTDIRFTSNSALAQHLSGDTASLFLGDMDQLPAHLLADRARLALLGAQLFVTLPGREQITGWLALGPRKSGEPYSRQDLAFIESLSEQASLAIERGQVVADLQRRVHEMNVLARVAQGVNVTINFDDILELIFAQTVQVLNTQHFGITLYNKSSNTFHHAFYVENDDRLSEVENHPIPDGLGLEQDVVRTQRGILTEDYVRECRQRNLIPATQGLYAWVGVPLNAGNETIGAISLGSSDPSVIYTVEQLDLLQAIADHAAGAIVKTRLIQESEERAQQLEMINQVGRSLTSTLDLDLLLNRILDSAVQILNCEAGSLLLVDEETDELVFEVTVGPVAEGLTGTRLPPGTGLVGKAVDTRQPIIDNNVQQSKDWFEKTDRETGFITRSILVVPMQLLDRVVGVIEVLNKSDRSPFTVDDQRLLTTFTAQAAVAIQNARLFTMTDQALAARVEELSVMQRIDRELNTSLDLKRVMTITLEWAMGQSRADAGLIAMLEQSSLDVMAHEGFDLQFSNPQIAGTIFELDSVQEAIETRLPQKVQLASVNGARRLLRSAQSQLILPILREQKSIGLLLLETERQAEFPPETLEFLTRLSDHAAIAISNAQFYNEVQEANIAKSDFISFVSHELKTPMTSIRGYTDLLAAGAVGKINEAQEGFLSTIRSNVLRMSTLVSDLADISQIETGRLSLKFGAVSIADVINEVVRTTERQVHDKEQNLIVDVPEDLPLAWADQTRLIQVVTNLVNNANKYTPKGGEIRIRVLHLNGQDRSLIPADLREGEGNPADLILVSIADTGIGIDDKDQPGIFTKFFRSDDHKAREAPGTGLGLNITKSLVEMQGGKIWFESEFRKGSTFFFITPVAETN